MVWYGMVWQGWQGTATYAQKRCRRAPKKGPPSCRHRATAPQLLALRASEGYHPLMAAPKGVPTNRHPAPATALEISMIARRRVRAMFKVLGDVAKDPGKPAAARVTAAKTIIEFAKIDHNELSKLDDSQLQKLVRKITETRLGKRTLHTEESADAASEEPSPLPLPGDVN